MAVAVIALMAVSPVAYADFQNGFAAYKRGDFVTALAQLTPLAEQGDPEIQFIIGSMYSQGAAGVPQDGKKAIMWLRKAAQKRHARAQYNLGKIYQNGHGVAPDDREAVMWLQLSAGQGVDRAQNDLGLMYHHGKGVSQDIINAHMWYDLAASKGNMKARRNRNFLEEEMTPEQITEAKKRATAWRSKH